ncbi:hypothetical protein EYC84_005400 [Monilinia fructicola]|uniref:Uncharacterized protein n=1 Tax=Monilinia fructicola TaxID=38448 RepID=A0A5M9K141_MONFR|nr:hypothetical protein EYC84_005400 [Monilinia fructicola]
MAPLSQFLQSSHNIRPSNPLLMPEYSSHLHCFYYHLISHIPFVSQLYIILFVSRPYRRFWLQVLRLQTQILT